MSSKVRKYSPSTFRRLDTLSGNQCSCPDCNNPLIARDGKSIISKICHIQAASKNGPRYNPSMSDDERRHYDNLILLCDECHILVDNKENVTTYTVKKLATWKKTHEDKNKTILLHENSTVLSVVIEAIAKMDFESEIKDKAENADSFDISAKISHNSVKRNKSLFEEYKVHYTQLNVLYGELEKQGSFRKENLLRNIRTLYLKIKGDYVADSENPMAVIQAHADDIIEEIEGKLYEWLNKEAPQLVRSAYFAVWIIMVDAFMRCKILEEPPKHD